MYVGVDDDQDNKESMQSLRDGSMWPDYCDPSYVMPTEINVRVENADGEYYFPLAIQKCTSKKPYLGGYRNKGSGRVFHHTSSQTPTEKRNMSKDFSNFRTRETQTFEQRTCSVQPYRECGTQMQRIDLYLDDSRDKVIVAKEYFTSQKLLALQRIKTIEIQRCWRGYIARCRASNARVQVFEYTHKAEIEHENMLETLKEVQNKEMDRRVNPRTKADFALLYNELDAWKTAEIERIKSTTDPGPERTKALSALLENHTKGLQNIDQLKLKASKEAKEENTKKMLEMMAQPQLWQLSTGTVAQVHTTSTYKAKELLTLYKSLMAPFTTVDERLETLLQVKWTVKPFSGQLVREIMELVDREADLLNRGRPPQSMAALRTRLANMFLQFTNDPKYNNRAAELMDLPPSAPPH